MNSAAPWPLTYHLTGDNPSLAREFSELLKNCGFIPVSEDSATISVIFVSSGELRKSQWQNDPIVDWRELKVRKQEEQFLFSYRSWDLVLDVSTATLRCSGPDPVSEERLIFREFFLLSPLIFMMHRLRYFELHAAACMYEEVGYLLLGPSGSGKTTTILSLIGSGWNYLSDDAMALSSNQEGKIFAHPLRRSFSLKPDHLGRHPELATYATEAIPPTNKRRFDPRQVWPDQYVDVVAPRFIISCKVSDKETTSIVPLSPAESLACLVGSAPWLMFDRAMAAAHLEIFRSLTKVCRGFELRAGHDLINGDSISSFIAPEALLNQSGLTHEEETWA